MGTVRREHLVYQSDFTVPSEHWREYKSDKSHSFFRNGYFYIAANPPSGHATRGGIPITDFRVTVDAEFMDKSSAGSVLGVVFRNNNHRQFYAFNVNWDGHYIIWFFHDNEWDRIVPAGLSEFIKRTGTNSLMVEMIGQKMTVSANGHVLASATDSRLSRGEVGVVVSAEKVYSEARFRNFQLFSVEYVSDYEIEIVKVSAKDVEREKLVMPAPIAPPGRQKTTQQPASTQRPSDLHAYLAGILEDGGMTDLNDEQREEMIQ